MLISSSLSRNIRSDSRINMVLPHFTRTFARIRDCSFMACRGQITARDRSLVADVDFIKFQLDEVLNVNEHLFQKIGRFLHVNNEMVDESLRGAVKIAGKYFLSHNKKNDSKEPVWNKQPVGGVHVSEEVLAALGAFKEAGFFKYEC